MKYVVLLLLLFSNFPFLFYTSLHIFYLFILNIVFHYDSFKDYLKCFVIAFCVFL